MMRGLCFHLLRQDEHLRNQLTNHYKLRSELGGWQPQEEELQQIVMAGFQTRSSASRRVVFFIDALDECDESSVRRTVHYLATLLEAAINADQRLDICLASRHYPTITAPRSVDIVVEHGNEHDISEYIARRIPYSVMPDSASVDTLRDMLLQKASGIFLWVVLVIDIVLRDIDEGKAGYEIEKSLADVPEDLAALFTDLMKTLRLKERAQSRALIFWVLLATQAVPARGVEALQLFMNESLQSLSDVQPALQSLEQRSLVWDDNIERVRRMVRTISRGLIEVTGASQVQFIHATVREFFLTEGPDLFKAHYFVPIGHCMIIKTCLHALCVLQHSKAKQREQLDIFSETSHIDWLQLYSRSLPRHAVEARREVNLPNQLIHSVDRVCSILMRRPITDHATGPERACQDINRKGLSPSILGDRHLVALCVDTALLCNQILEALECGRAAHELPGADLALFATLIDSSHWKLGLSLPVAAQEDPFGFQIRQSQQRDAMIRLQRVISNGAPVMSRDSEGNTAMHFAAWLGMSDFIDILCDHGHALDVQNNYELTPLHLAIQYGHLDAASRLLARGANPSVAGPQGYTGLHFSLESSSKPMVHLLLNSGASVSARDAFGRTPLHAGAKYGAARDVLTLLIQADADPLALDYDLVTPVMIATYYGLDSSSWSDPRQRWNGHKTNFTKMMESRIGHRPHSALDPTPASLFSPPPHPPDVKRQSGLLAAPGDGWPVSDHLPLGLDDGTNRRRSESPPILHVPPSGCI
ncbi:uncharacterized protein E0L32_003767 [Thyridium curvatum]|uniref:Nephrocystin 3-like N-terminal domain-containing protein n=1 Tax=Thyridium curvatum TaxID=1093900 RepID=A0A507BA34_9PEZI|nr:uncharacterized protein E0L32_003767 [Thyridium curvatum]TPX16473.1 hypothetical protein E0L32_003767 [Thyridium curvatum]